MKQLLFIVILAFLPYLGSGQSISLKNRIEFKGDTIIFLDNNYKVLPLDSMGYRLFISDTSTHICVNRGHIKLDGFTETLMYCPPYVIENDSQAIKVYPSCNTRTYYCLRCGEKFSEAEPERREIIWQKEKVYPTIRLFNNGAKIDTTFARNDLERDQAKDSQIFIDNLIIESQKQELAEKDTLISEQAKVINDLQQRYLMATDMFVTTDRALIKTKKVKNVFKWSFKAMLVIAFYLGVK